MINLIIVKLHTTGEKETKYCKQYFTCQVLTVTCYYRAWIPLLLSQLPHLCHRGAPRHRGERPVKRRSAGNEESGETASFPLSLGSYFWGLSSGSFKWGLVTAGTSWTKLLLPAPLLCCSHSPLIGFDCICLNPQWKKEKGGWRGCSETEVCQFVQTRWHFRKRGYHSLGLLNKGWGYDAWWVTEQA